MFANSSLQSSVPGYGRGSEGGSISGWSGATSGSWPGPGGGSGVGIGAGSPLGTTSGSGAGSCGVVVMPAGTRHLACSGHGPSGSPLGAGRRLAGCRCRLPRMARNGWRGYGCAKLLRIPRPSSSRRPHACISVPAPRTASLTTAVALARPRWPPPRPPSPWSSSAATTAAHVAFDYNPLGPHHLHPVGAGANQRAPPARGRRSPAHGSRCRAAARPPTTATPPTSRRPPPPPRTVTVSQAGRPAQPHQRGDSSYSRP